MTTKTELKQALDAAQAAYLAEQAKLTAQGLKSAQRYELLKPLKAVVDAANAAFVGAAKAAVNKKLDAFIAANAPRVRAEKLARSPWKQAKAAAKANG